MYQIGDPLGLSTGAVTNGKSSPYGMLNMINSNWYDNANVNIGSIQRILGHENRSTTEIYPHSIGEAEREAMRIYEEVSQDSPTISHTDSHTEINKELTLSG
jgi:hypothetical protein